MFFFCFIILFRALSFYVNFCLFLLLFFFLISVHISDLTISINADINSSFWNINQQHGLRERTSTARQKVHSPEDFSSVRRCLLVTQ